MNMSVVTKQTTSTIIPSNGLWKTEVKYEEDNICIRNSISESLSFALNLLSVRN